MSDIDFSDLGRDIEEKVNKFVNSKEMKDLQENIRGAVEKTMEEVRRSTKDAADYVNKNVDIRWESSTPKQSKSASAPVRVCGKRQLPVTRKPQGRVSGALMSVFGTCGAIVGWTVSILGYSLSAVSIDIFGSTGIAGMAGIGMISSGFVATVAAVCTAAAVAGRMLRKRAKRFRSYVKVMGNKDFYSIEGLAQAVGKKEKFVIKDIKKMIHRKWFKEGHLDEKETCFMLTDESYQMYLDAQAELVRRKEEAQRLAQEQEMLEQDPLRKQLKIAVEEGQEYIRRIRIINDDIPGEEISGKLSRLEKICTRIFSYVEENPEKLLDIRKFMSYYLPTTLKLVETYHEFSIQPVQGDNITTAKNEIEDMLDSINLAFEKMFDKLFEEDAMDISTDISVLSTMLAQEGLLEDEFRVK